MDLHHFISFNFIFHFVWWFGNPNFSCPSHSPLLVVFWYWKREKSKSIMKFEFGTSTKYYFWIGNFGVRSVPVTERSFSLVGRSLNNQPSSKGPIGIHLNKRLSRRHVLFLNFLHLLAFSAWKARFLPVSSCFRAEPSFFTGLWRDCKAWTMVYHSI